MGVRFGRHLVVSRAANNVEGRARWVCRCDCGEVREVSAGSLKRGDSTSCGCLARELASTRETTHGEASRKNKSPEYRTWNAIIDRTTNPSTPKYPDYGGRGIKVCKRWRSSFVNFLADMGRRPSPQHSLDRINNDLGYNPKNCRWATAKEQSRNTRNNHILIYRGESKSIAEWAEIKGFKYATLYMRIQRAKMTVEEAFENPVGRWAK
jgi:hypothetical protein